MGIEDTDTKAVLEMRALYKARELGHAIPRIIWEAGGDEGAGTCTRCGDGVLLYIGPEGTSINGTAYEFPCPGNTCEHGWAIHQSAEGAVLLRCHHCGATRSEG